jgi:trehalose synthase
VYGTLALIPKVIDDYAAVVGEDGVAALRAQASPLRGLRVLHLSATAFGTGVAELLHSAVPLMTDLGLHCDWQVVRPAEEFAAVNKTLYRCLADTAEWSEEMADVWLRYSSMNAELLTEHYDVIIVHDPQPAAIRSYVSDTARASTRWVLHTHLDLSACDSEAWRLIHGHISEYDRIVFDAEAFVNPALTSRATIIPPAIDPLGPRNMQLDTDVIETILERYGLDPSRPIICQVSPCHPASDLLGVIDVHDRVRRQVPGLQLAIIASSPPDDAASIAYFDEVVRKSMDYSDAHIMRGVSEVGNVEVNAFQRASAVVLQKGLRRGFGIWISDAQWKERPVVAARHGAIEQQVIDGRTGFLAATTDEFVDRVNDLLRQPELARRIGAAAHQHVADHFLITRFLADELRLLSSLAGGEN